MKFWLLQITAIVAFCGFVCLMLTTALLLIVPLTGFALAGACFALAWHLAGRAERALVAA